MKCPPWSHIMCLQVGATIPLRSKQIQEHKTKKKIISSVCVVQDFNCVVDGPDCILSHVNMATVCDEVNRSETCPVKAVVSYNAGRYERGPV